VAQCYLSVCVTLSVKKTQENNDKMRVVLQGLARQGMDSLLYRWVELRYFGDVGLCVGRIADDVAQLEYQDKNSESRCIGDICTGLWKLGGIRVLVHSCCLAIDHYRSCHDTQQRRNKRDWEKGVD